MDSCSLLLLFARTFVCFLLPLSDLLFAPLFVEWTFVRLLLSLSGLMLLPFFFEWAFVCCLFSLSGLLFASAFPFLRMEFRSSQLLVTILPQVTSVSLSYSVHCHISSLLRLNLIHQIMQYRDSPVIQGHKNAESR